MELVKDESEMTREEKIESLVPVARMIANSMSKGLGFSRLEINLSYAYFGIIAAVDKFDPSKGMTLRSFAFKKARFEVLNGWRNNATIARHTWRAIQVAEEKGTPGPVPFTTEPLDADVVDRIVGNAEDRPTEDEAVNRLACEQILGGLKPQLAFVLRRRFLDQAVLAEIASELNVSESRISQLTRSAIQEAKLLIAA